MFDYIDTLKKMSELHEKSFGKLDGDIGNEAYNDGESLEKEFTRTEFRLLIENMNQEVIKLEG